MEMIQASGLVGRFGPGGVWAERQLHAGMDGAGCQGCLIQAVPMPVPLKLSLLGGWVRPFNTGSAQKQPKGEDAQAQRTWFKACRWPGAGVVAGLEAPEG